MKLFKVFFIKLPITVIAVIFCMAVHAQDASISFFEVEAYPTMDSSQHSVTVLLAVNQSEDVASINIEVEEAEGQTLAYISSSIATLKSSYPYRIENGVLYITIETGAHAPSPYYQATAILTPTAGGPLEYTRTKQM